MNYPDIFFTEEYQQLFKDTEFGGIPEQFTCAGIDYRFYKRPIPDTPYFDIVSPYGYSGPVAITLKPEETIFESWYQYSSNFNEYCKANNIIAEFARLHSWETPVFINMPHYCRNEHDIYDIDLTRSYSDIWAGFDKSCKSSIRQQEKNNYLHFDNNRLDGWYSYFEKSPNYKFGKSFLNMVLDIPEARLVKPPPTVEYNPLAELRRPPTAVE